MARPSLLRWIAAALVLAGAAVFASSCLNPRPDDMPSAGLPGSTGSQPPSTVGPMSPTGNNPGIGGDNLTEDLDDDGDLPIDPGNEPLGMGNPSVPAGEGNSGDAGIEPGSGVPGPDAGPDGG